MSLAKRDEISLREFVRRHKFQLKRRIEKAVKEPEGKILSADEFY